MTTECVPKICGDGIISPGETCDDGNMESGDGCNDLCEVPTKPKLKWDCKNVQIQQTLVKAGYVKERTDCNLCSKKIGSCKDPVDPAKS